MKKFIFFIFFILSVNLVYSANVDYKIENSLKNQNYADVIVYLNEPSNNFFSFNGKNIRTNLINSLNEDIELKYEYSSLNGFSGKINKNALERLKQNKNVKAIYLNQERHIFLQDSVPLINAPVVHDKLINNLNLTGKGQTVCILDTGINYSHSDFGGCSKTDFLNGNCSKIIGGWNYVNNNNDPYDDQGHGTHVSGIVASNGNLKGVAPEANLVIVKVCDFSGGCYDGDVLSGINFCINNKIQYNISVISMSLGGGLSSTYCNGDNLAPGIDLASANNISVTIASGNSGSDSSISAPACVENAISVASSNKQDSISSFSNRNNITTIIAPGENINSINWGNGILGCNNNRDYIICSGTSMSTPHVSGAIALLQQYKQQESNRQLTVTEIKNALKNSDKNITDTNGLNYTRLNVNKALISIDNKIPNFDILIFPNQANLTLNNININFSGYDTNLETVFVNVSYPNGTLLKKSFSNFTLTNELSVVGDYGITIFVNDSNGNYNSSSYILKVNNPELPIVTLNYPENYINTSNSLVDFNCSFTDDDNLANVSLFINQNGNFTLNQTNFISGTNNQTNFTLNLEDGEYSWNCLAYDNSSNSNFASNNFTFRIDTSKPVISNVLTSSITHNSVLISWETNEITNSTINYGIDSNDPNFILSHSITLSSLTSNTVYFYNITSCDLVSNCNISGPFTFTTLPQPVSDSPGGSGGGGGGGGSGGGGGNSNNQVSNQVIPQTQPVITNVSNKPKLEIKKEENKTQDIEIKKEENQLTGKTTFEGIKTNKTLVIVVVLLLIIGIFSYFKIRKKNQKTL